MRDSLSDSGFLSIIAYPRSEETPEEISLENLEFCPETEEEIDIEDWLKSPKKYDDRLYFKDHLKKTESLLDNGNHEYAQESESSVFDSEGWNMNLVMEFKFILDRNKGYVTYRPVGFGKKGPISVLHRDRELREKLRESIPYKDQAVIDTRETEEMKTYGAEDPEPIPDDIEKIYSAL